MQQNPQQNIQSGINAKAGVETGVPGAIESGSVSQRPRPAIRRRARVVILGAGFAGLSVARQLANRNVDVTIVDRQNHHLFQPLLYQVATAELSPGDIAWPVRTILRGAANVRVMMAEVVSIAHEQKTVLLTEGELQYDYLVVATGVTHDYFGNDDWSESARGLKTIDDATRIRRRVLLAFERAELAKDDAQIDRLLTFVVVGAGPTGVELAGALAELARNAMPRDFRHIETTGARVLLVEAGDSVLSSFNQEMRDYAHAALIKLGVEVHLGEAITDCTADGVVIGDKTVAAANVLWAAGVKADGPARWLGAQADRAGRIVVDRHLGLADMPDVYVIGDCACVTGADGKPVPGVAPAAKQQGSYIGQRILANMNGRESDAFVYKDVGSLATIGRNQAVVDLGWLRLRGRPAWWTWGIVHIYFLIGTRNRMLVAMQWLWAYVTSRRGVRLITGAGADKVHR